MTPDLTDRQRRILARLVIEYIEQGDPVSSSWLAENSALGLSSATVRHILARLEELGLVRQPHTSAGRVPTDSGYRLYVDGLLGGRRRRALPEVEARLRQAGTVSDLLEHASHELSRASHQIGFALSSSPAMRLQHIDFVNLDAGRVVVVVVGSGGQITHKVITPSERIDSTTLLHAANYINHEFAGLTLHEVRSAIVERLRQERVLYDALAARALELAQNGLAAVAPEEETLYVQGASFLMDQLLGEAGGEGARALETLRALFRMIEEKHTLVELLTKYIETDGLTVVIGSEHALPDLRPFSMVASTFSDGRQTGTVAVIGPTRMRYQRTIAVVDGVSQAVSRVLEGANNHR